MGALAALCAALLAGWQYDPRWAARHPTDHDAIAAAVAPDIFNSIPLGGPALNRSFASPCWHEAAAAGARALRCLPAFYLIGGFQCAVHDLARRIALSPDAAPPPNAHHAFWSSGPGFGGSWDRFLAHLDRAVSGRIAKRPTSARMFIANPAMLAFTWAEHARVHDAYAQAVQTCWRRCRKELQPAELAAQCGDRGYKLDHCARLAYEADAASAVGGAAGAAFALPQLMRRAHGPELRLVALLRNPADRLWSALASYPQFAHKYGKGEAGVLAYFSEQSAAFGACAAQHGSRVCALRFESLGQEWQDVFYHCDQLIKGMYSVFVEEWQLAFGRERLLLLRSEEYMDARTNRRALDAVLRFVGLPSDAGALDLMVASKPKPGGPRGTLTHHARSWTMSAGLRAHLGTFYRPFNERLAELSGDEAYRDWPVHMPAATPEGSPHR